ncbi:MAG: arylsulfatase A-like enzyme [Myxococcota bacterium]|jgi:arylsulfatase A-like enzyme
MIPLLIACQGAKTEDTTVPYSDFTSRFEPAEVVVVVFVDTLARQHMSGWQTQAQTTPVIDDFFDTSVVFENTFTVRGLTSVATASVLTGTYPRTHGVRNNSGWSAPSEPTLIERFEQAGYHTIGLAANACQFIDGVTDTEDCVWSQNVEGIDSVVGITHEERDRLLLSTLSERLDERPKGTPLFVWIHLMNPHEPYTRVESWYSEFHPEPYTGTLDATDGDQLDDAILGELPIEGADLAEIHAVYRSQLRETDAVFEGILSAFDERGLRDEAVIAFGADHGEALGARSNYLYHGCSLTNEVNVVPFAISAPGRLPVAWHSEWVSQVDFAPTLADVAGIGWTGQRDGENLVDGVLAGAIEERPLFAEGGGSTAIVLSGGYKYIRDENQGNSNCPPYNLGQPYPGQRDALYDLLTDPGETTDLTDTETVVLSQLRGELCDWVLDGTWTTPETDPNNPLVRTCKNLSR